MSPLPNTDPQAIAYRQLVSATADEEPVTGWSSASDLSCLTGRDVQTVLANRPQGVLEEITFDALELQRALAAPDFLILLGARMGIALERAAREALWMDVAEERDRRDEERRDSRESAESRHGVASLFRGAHR